LVPCSILHGAWYHAHGTSYEVAGTGQSTVLREWQWGTAIPAYGVVPTAYRYHLPRTYAISNLSPISPAPRASMSHSQITSHTETHTHITSRDCSFSYLPAHAFTPHAPGLLHVYCTACIPISETYSLLLARSCGNTLHERAQTQKSKHAAVATPILSNGPARTHSKRATRLHSLSRPHASFARWVISDQRLAVGAAAAAMGSCVSRQRLL
jgi:hypothetical protein